jgi:hypothetical protein
MASRIKRARGWCARPKPKNRKVRKPLSLVPHKLTADAWFYDQRGGINLTIWTTSRVHKGDRQADHIYITWRKLRAALARNGKI